MTHLLPPDYCFATLRSLLGDLGWAEQRLPAVLPPLIAGEPEAAAFTRGDQRLDYHFNPALLLRVLQGPVPVGLPTLVLADLPTLIAAPDPATALLGAAAAAELGQGALRPAILMRAAQLPPALARHALQAAHRMAPLCAEAMHFADLPPDRQRQSLRLALHHASPDAADLVTLGLAGAPDIAATAMIGAARLGLDHLLPAFPRLKGGGELFLAIRKAAMATLAGQRPGRDDSPRTQFWLALLGQGNAAMSLRLAPLLVPLPDVPPPELHGGIRFCRVAAFPHWLGDADQAETVRRWTPQPFLIAEVPCLNCTTAGVMSALADLSHATGLHLRLPQSEELQCALRGPDGRLAPSDRNAQGGWQAPWGLLPGTTRQEFCLVDQILHLCPSSRPVLARVATSDDEPAGLRPVLDRSTGPSG